MHDWYCSVKLCIALLGNVWGAKDSQATKRSKKSFPYLVFYSRCARWQTKDASSCSRLKFSLDSRFRYREKKSQSQMENVRGGYGPPTTTRTLTLASNARRLARSTIWRGAGSISPFPQVPFSLILRESIGGTR